MPKSKAKPKSKAQAPDPLLVELTALSAVIKHGFDQIADILERSLGQNSAEPSDEAAP